MSGPEEASAARAEIRIAALTSVLARNGLDLESEIRGASMGDTLPHGSRIRIRCDAVREPRLGQILAFTSGRTLVAHRLVHLGRGRAEGYFLFRGDAFLFSDPPIPRDAIVGPVTAVLRNGAWQPLAEQSPSADGRRRLRGLILTVERTVLQVHPTLPRMLGAVAAAIRGAIKRRRPPTVP